jgi:hypothetical protein
MRRALLMMLAWLATGAAFVSWESEALADKNDLVFSRLSQQGGMPVANFSDPAFVRQASTQFRALASELGVALAPKMLTPAESLGWNGFNASLDFA